MLQSAQCFPGPATGDYQETKAGSNVKQSALVSRYVVVRPHTHALAIIGTPLTTLIKLSLF